MKELHGYTPDILEKKLLAQLFNDLNCSESDLNKYRFDINETLSKEEILERIRTVSVQIDTENTFSTWCRIGEIEADSITKDELPYPVNYDIFIDTVANHYSITLIDSCTSDDFYGLACEDFLMQHFADKSIVNLSHEVQKAIDFKLFKRNILKLMKNNIDYWKKTANGGGTGFSIDGYVSFYSGSVFVNDFSVDCSACDIICRYKNIDETQIKLTGDAYWKTLYYYLLSKCNTLF